MSSLKTKLGYTLLLSLLLLQWSCQINQVGNPDADKVERIPGIDYLHDEEQREVACEYPNSDSHNLLITEVTKDWIEIFNRDSSGSTPICLVEYVIRARIFGVSRPTFFPLPEFNFEPQSYIVIRFNGWPGNNSVGNVISVNGPELLKEGSRYVGFYEIAAYDSSTSNYQSVDFMRFCSDDPDKQVSPLTGSFTGCVNYLADNYQSFSRSKDLSDSDSGGDWKGYGVPTFGGPNDVTYTTDNDQDGIPDANEQAGTTFAGMPLYEWGARVNQRDIFVHIDYMDGRNIFSKEGLAPPQASLDKVKRVFSENGFAIHFDVGDLYSRVKSPENYNFSGRSHEVLYSTYLTIDSIPSTEVPELVSINYYKNRYMPANRFGIFHYSLFANLTVRGSSPAPDIQGIAELPGNDLAIFSGGNPHYSRYIYNVRVNITASVLLHELGHNFNLRHGGNENAQYKPNHFSSMNYSYMYSGVPATNDSSNKNFFHRYLLEFHDQETFDGIRLIDNIANDLGYANFKINYSYGNMPPINESNIVEINPLGAGIGNIDWNYNKKIETKKYKFNVNPKDDIGQPFRVLKDYDEWGNLKLPFNHEDGGGNYSDLRLGDSESVIPSRFRHLAQGFSEDIIVCKFGHLHIQ